MLRLRRDPSGDLARLACDACGRLSRVWLGGGRIDAAAAPVARDWLRLHCGALGWTLLASEQDGRAMTLDLCPRCARKAAKTPRPPTEET